MTYERSINYNLDFDDSTRKLSLVGFSRFSEEHLIMLSAPKTFTKFRLFLGFFVKPHFEIIDTIFYRNILFSQLRNTSGRYPFSH